MSETFAMALEWQKVAKHTSSQVSLSFSSVRALLDASIVLLSPALAQTLFSRVVSENSLTLHQVSFSEG